VTVDDSDDKIKNMKVIKKGQFM